jgi:hypothetical protein
MATLIAWTANALNDQAAHPLMIIAVFIALPRTRPSHDQRLRKDDRC